MRLVNYRLKISRSGVFLFALCSLLFAQSCQTTGVDSRNVYKSSGKSSEQVVKVSLFTPSRNSKGERFIYYTILVSKSWCEKKGRRIDDPLAKVVAPFVTFEVDDAVMNEFLNYILDSGFQNWPERMALDVEKLKQVDKSAPVLFIETPTIKKTILATDLRDSASATAFNKIRLMFIDLANRYPSTRVWTGGVQEPKK